MPFVTDKKDLVAFAGESSRLLMHLGYQRAGCIDGSKVARGRLFVNRRRNAMSAEDHERTLGNLIGLVDEDGPTLLQCFHDVFVVDDLLADVDGGAMHLEGTFHGFNGTIHTSAVAARCCKKHLLDAGLLAAIQLIHPSIVERGDRIGLFAP